MTDNSTALLAEGADETIDPTDTEAMKIHGITRVMTATYLVGAYRYTTLADALAEAKRAGSRP